MSELPVWDDGLPDPWAAVNRPETTILPNDWICTSWETAIDAISPKTGSRKVAGDRLRWHEKKTYEFAVKTLKRALEDEDNDDIGFAHDMLRQLHGESLTLGTDCYKKRIINMHKQRQHMVDRLEQMVRFSYEGEFTIKNPLLHSIWVPWALCELHQMQDDSCSSNTKYGSALRDFSTKEYAWAVPTREAMAAILTYNRTIVELGSGSGYWASCLQAAGGHVTAVDDGSGKFQPRFYPATIIQDGAKYLQEQGGAKDATLFVCWGCHFNDALAAFQGEYLAVVGEPLGGCTWWPGDGCDRDDLQPDKLKEAVQQSEQWRCIREVRIPCWEYVHDILAIFQRVPMHEP